METLLEAGKIMGVFGAAAALMLFGVNWAKGKKGMASAQDLNCMGKRLDTRLDVHEKRIGDLEYNFRRTESQLERIENKVDKNEIKSERISDAVASIDKKMERICALFEAGVKTGVFNDRRDQ